MERFFKRKFSEEITSGSEEGASSGASASCPTSDSLTSTRKEVVDLRKEIIDLNSILSDPAERKKIYEYNPNQMDEIRRAYLLKGPCQPRGHDFPRKMIGKYNRRFNLAWFDQYANWLEYSIKEDKAYCLPCYLFRDHFGNQGGSVEFVNEGFSTWNKTERLEAHVGAVSSAHNLAVMRCEDLLRQNQSISVAFHKQSDIMKTEYRVRLCASIECCRHLLHQGLSFRGHKEFEGSMNRGNFIETIKLIADFSDSVNKVVLKNAPQNHQMVAPSIQKDIVHCFTQEIVQTILKEFNDDYFSLLVDESSDVSGKEQMVVVLRFVDSDGNVKERFICVIHVQETSALSLKSTIDNLFSDLGLSLMKIRGQGYDGASNMKGQFKGLKTLIMKENESAYYVHCFAHQLQLTLVAVAHKHADIEDFFNMISTLMNAVGASCKRKDNMRQKQAEKIEAGIRSGLIETGTGLNQELSLKRAGDTRWGSHQKSLANLVILFSSVMDVLVDISCDTTDGAKRGQARGLLTYFNTFDFVFYLHLMLTILGITNELSTALQRKDGDILNAMSLVKITKSLLQEVRDDGWESLLSDITAFCNKHEIGCLNMDDTYVSHHYSRRKTNITNGHHYRVDCFYEILDLQLAELDDRFNEINSELLCCVGSLSPIDNFGCFDKARLIRLAELYPNDFSPVECMNLPWQLDIYIRDMKSDDRFSQLKGLVDLSTKLVETRKHLSYPLLYRLLKLALILPVATTSVERCFSAMTLIKTDLRNQISDQFLNDCLVCYIEKEFLCSIKTDDVIKRFQNMRTRKEQS